MIKIKVAPFCRPVLIISTEENTRNSLIAVKFNSFKHISHQTKPLSGVTRILDEKAQVNAINNPIIR